MKRHYLQYTLGGIGTICVIAGLVWACQRFVATPRATAQTQQRVSTAEAVLDPLSADEGIRFAEHQASGKNLITVDGQAVSDGRVAREPVSVALRELAPEETADAQESPTEFPTLRVFDDKASASSGTPTPQSLTEEPGSTTVMSLTPLAADAMSTTPATSDEPAMLQEPSSLPTDLPQSSLDSFPQFPTPAPEDAVNMTPAAPAAPTTESLPLENQAPLVSETPLENQATSLPPASLSDPLASPTDASPSLSAPSGPESSSAGLPVTSSEAATSTLSDRTATPSASAGSLPTSDPLASTPVTLPPMSQSLLTTPDESGIKTGEAAQKEGELPGRGMPGIKALEGVQAASITLEKRLPAEVQVGRHETITLILRNVGTATAKNVVLRDLVPARTSFISAEPHATATPDGALVWEPFDLAAQEELEVNYIVVPTDEGEIGSVASVTFNTEASAKTVCTRPMLKLDVTAPKEVLIGEKATLNIQVSNPGTGTATGVVLLEKVPAGLTHEGGKILDNRIETIAPGETKEIALALTATAPGKTLNYLSVSADNGLLQEVTSEIVVNSPELELEIVGSGVKYLGREATYTLKIHNPGSAPAKDVKLMAELPKNMKFVSTNNLGQYDGNTHSVHWELVELPNNVEPGEIELVLLPTDLGDGRLSLVGEGAHELACNVTENVQVDGLAALTFAVNAVTGPVEVGREAVYEIQLSNRGTKASSNIHVVVQIPPTMKITDGTGPTKLQSSVSEVSFERLATLAPQQEAVYTIKAVCSEPGDHRIKVLVSSDDLELLAKEESTRVYR
ncbi:MAG: hypothetical protein Q4G68_13770 [Planctomycetia bacterium]|nr:hypothetical protein [Planctomycetia bacterium]